jgi:hypothetical protein
VTLVWALESLAWLSVAVLLPVFGGAGSELMGVAVLLVACAATGLPLLVRLSLFLQQPRGRTALEAAETRRLAIALGLTAAVHAALMVASAL